MRRTADIRQLVVQADMPASAADWTGESGGTYQTIGSVRYSGCSGKATFHSIAIL